MSIAGALKIGEGLRGVTSACAGYVFQCTHGVIKDVTVAGLFFRCVDTIVQGTEKIFKIDLKHLQPLLVASETVFQFSTFPKTFSKLSPLISGKVFVTDQHNGAVNIPVFLSTVFRAVDQGISCSVLLEKYNITRLGSTALLCSRVTGLGVKVLQTGLKRFGVYFDVIALAVKVILQGKVEIADCTRLIGNVVAFTFAAAANPLILSIALLVAGALSLHGIIKQEPLPNLRPHFENIGCGAIDVFAVLVSKVERSYRAFVRAGGEFFIFCTKKVEEVRVLQKAITEKTQKKLDQFGDVLVRGFGFTSSQNA